MARIGIIGAGPAGLGCASELAKKGHGVTVFEQSSVPGGLTRSIILGDICVEQYYHFLTSGDKCYADKLKELKLVDNLCWKLTKMGYFIKEHLFPFSGGMDLLRFNAISLKRRFRYGLLVIYCALLQNWHDLDEISAVDWLTRIIGKEAFQMTWYPLLYMKFHERYKQITAAWIWHRIHRIANSRKTLFHQERLGYINGGSDVLIQALCKEISGKGGEVKCNEAACRIIVEKGQATSIQTIRNTYAFDYIVCAVPLPIFLQLVPDLPQDYHDSLASIDFLNVVCVVMRLSYPFTSNFWININDPRIPFNGCIEYTNLDASATADGSSILYIPFYLPRDHWRYHQTDVALIEDCVHALQIVNPRFRPDWVLSTLVGRDLYAQVVCNLGFSQQIPGHITPIKRLFLIESCQLYPSDRTISGTLQLSTDVAKIIDQQEKESIS